MNLSAQKQRLTQLVTEIAEDCDEPIGVFYPTMSSREDSRIKLKCFDIDTIKAYFEDALTQNHHHEAEVKDHAAQIKYWPYDEESEEEMDAFMGQNPDFQKAFKFFNDVMAAYLDDLRATAGKIGAYKISGNIEEIKEELEKEEMLSEGLPQILHDFDGQARVSPQPTNFFSGLRRMLEEGRFVNEGNRCPFGMRVSDIFAFKPERDQSTGQVKISSSQDGALPAFIYNELRQAVEFGSAPSEQISAEANHE